MANWKKVDADQLDADLTSVADAIRERAGTTEQMNFPDGFVSAVEGIPDDSVALMDRSITEIENEKVTSIGSNAFNGCSKLTKISFPNVTKATGSAFANCTALVDVNLPNLASIGNNVFQNCGFSVFDIPCKTSFGGSVFKGCTKLVALVLRANTMSTTASANIFENTPIASGTGYIYVPSSLVDSYKAATNWTTYADQFRALEDYTVDGTTTGALDESKI